MKERRKNKKKERIKIKIIGIKKIMEIIETK